MPMDWFEERPLGRWANLLTAASPNCFRRARTLREAPERGRLLLREPNAALPLGPRIGQRLGEAGDREICRRGPGTGRSAEPLRQFERIGDGNLLGRDRLQGS